ncbi:PKD domain-containing protein [Maribellus sediminis]|uniref:PKD domain-containing protein n=1 Tax=Maribellus sediminis TaxID=2696285 RepID=UPI0014302C2C|nr:PKD domain-containing protein [Maribellus sediminis]
MKNLLFTYKFKTHKFFTKYVLALCILFICAISEVSSQTVTFTFDGKNVTDETPLNIDSVYIINLANGSDTLVEGNVFTTSTTTIKTAGNSQTPNLLVYPNPFSKEATISFYSPKREKAQIIVYTVNGIKIAEWNSTFESGINTFSLKSSSSGILLLNITTDRYQFTSKLLCLEESALGKLRLLNANTANDFERQIKSITVSNSEFKFKLGDSLTFMGYSGGFISEPIHDVPGGDKHYTFGFDFSDKLPVALFDVSSRTTNQGNAISFFDKSLNSPVSWLWDFGDGKTSLEQNPTHIYTTIGAYSVQLIVENDFGSDTLHREEYILVNSSAPLAEFTADVTSINQGQTVNFFDQSTNSPTAWKWEFGDGNTSTLQNPAHIYSLPGTYSVSLLVENEYGSDTLIKQNYIEVNTLKPKAEFSANTTIINSGETIIFTDLSTNSPTSWKWVFGDENTSTLQNPSHVYSQPGAYTVSLFVENVYGSDTIVKTDYIQVLEKPEPLLNVSPNSLDFDSITTQKIFEITNAGSGTLSWSVSENLNWLTVSLSSGSTTTETNVITVTVNRSGLSAGTYSGVIAITSDGGNKEVSVTMEIKDESPPAETPKKPGWK